MKKTSLKLVFLFSLTVIAMCSYLGDAREMVEEEVNYLGGDTLAISPTMTIPGDCRKDSECKEFCPKLCPAIGKHCSSLSDAREMAKEEVNCIGGCPDGEKNSKCLPSPVTPTMDSHETSASCSRDSECIKFCPKVCKIVNCNFGTCFCSYLGDARQMAEEEVNYLDGPSLAPVSPIMVINGFCHKDLECGKNCPRACTSHGRSCICSCRSRKCHCAC
ncbi:unnamed protein product [Microthlaspi erraticum]|uniref:Uncharacterized protein n=1 Tax=Microthlaspi erraticum TaxID=1685480 RepID=A0A6D2KK36_9BRAS|nr:unnamed protein product [Microthlaspi erraticum]